MCMFICGPFETRSKYACLKMCEYSTMYFMQSAVALNRYINWPHVRLLFSLKYYSSYPVDIMIVIKEVLGWPSTLDQPNRAGRRCKQIFITLVDKESSLFLWALSASAYSRYRWQSVYIPRCFSLWGSVVLESIRVSVYILFA